MKQYEEDEIICLESKPSVNSGILRFTGSRENVLLI
jgi:hypothetical protein